MSLPTKKFLLFNKTWQNVCLVTVAAVVLMSVLFCTVYVSLNFFGFLKTLTILLAVLVVLLSVLIYFRLLHKKKKALLVILSILLVICMSILNTVTFMHFSGKVAMLKNNSTPFIPHDIDAVIDASGIVSYGDDKYIYNDNLTTILFMGIDKNDIDKTSVNGKNGQADAVYAVTIDTKTGKSTVICISRDTVTDIKIYSKEGNYIRTEPKQLCLSYAYGDGKELSCENCVWSASNVLFGIPINTYMAIDYSAIAVLNDAVGGVEVPKYNSNWSKKTGETTVLYGEKAYEYVQFRDIYKTESNAYRITRQLDYLKAFSAKAIKMTKKDITTPLNLYDKINKYSVNNLSPDKIAFLTNVFLNGNKEIEFKNIEGKIDTVGNHAVFYPDSEKLYELVLEVFYTKIS